MQQANTNADIAIWRAECMRFSRIKNKPGHRPVASVTDEIREALKGKEFSSLEDANATLRAVTSQFNARPMAEFGGLSPEQVFRLTKPDWLDNSVRLNGKLPITSVSNALHFHNVRALLTIVNEWGEVKLTQTGAFNRKFVSALMPQLWFEDFIRKVIDRYQVVNESDVPYLEFYRNFLPEAGLLNVQPKGFQITETGKRLLADDRADELFTLLFRTMFTTMNIGALDRLPDFNSVQGTLGYSMYRLARMPEGWLNINEIACDLILPFVRDEIISSGWPETEFGIIADLRVLKHFVDFGLLEFGMDKSLYKPDKVRKTALFKEYLTFNL